MSSEGEHIGKIVDIMLDVRRGRVPYAVLPEGGFLGMGSTPHAIPWSALTLETDEKCFFATYRPNKSRTSPVSKDHWPSMADAQWGAATVHQYYNRARTGLLPALLAKET
jgi:hypothetical protein